MAVSKVILNGTTLIDVTDKTVVADKLLTGYTALKNDGTAITGTYSGTNPPAPFKDVNFFDYDGTILYSYSASEFANLTELPANPTHSGLTAQGWNWTLADAKTQVADTGFLDIGQMYITSDGKTRIYITISDMAANSLRLQWTQSVANSVTIDWGDDSTTAAQSGTGNKSATHTYSSIGEYVIAMTVSSGTMTLGQGTSAVACLIGAVSGSVGVNRYRAMCNKIEIGANCTLQNLYSMNNIKTISMPNSITSLPAACYGLYNLNFLTIPTNCASFTGTYMFRYVYMQNISLPKGCTTMNERAFQEMISLRRINLPNVTSLKNYTFYNCYMLSSLIVPSTVTSIDEYAFGNCSGLAEIHFRPTTPPTVTDSNAFTNLPTDCKIYVPSGKLSNYTTATNYPSSSTYTYIEE